MDYIFNGMRRAGNHAVIHWIVSHTRGPLIWYNNVRAGQPPKDNKIFWYRDGERCQEFFEKPIHTVTSYEEQPYQGGIVVLRDAYNVAASRIAKAQQRPKSAKIFQSTLPVHDRYIEKWIHHATVEADLTILYNEWVRSWEYRQQVLDFSQLGPELPLERVITRPGLGSSFTKSKNLEDLGDVNERYTQVELPHNILAHDQLRELNLQIFGWALDRNGNYIE